MGALASFPAVVRPQVDAQEPLVLGALEPDQLVAAKHPYGRRHLGRFTRGLLWGLRLYLLLTLVVVGDRILQVAGGR